MAKAPTKKQVEADNLLLKQIVDATRTEVGCTTAKAADVQRLVDAGFVEAGGEAENGEIYIRASETGLAQFPLAITETGNVAENSIQEDISVMSDVQTAVDVAAPAAKRTHKPHVMVDASTITQGLGLPPVGKRGGGAGRKGVYPFDGLAAPTRDAAGNIIGMAYFFVPGTDERPDPARSLNATVSGANKKAKEAGPAQDTGIEKAFKVFADTENGVDGAKVFRVQ